MLEAYTTGLGLGAALIAAIGAQNAFVVAQGLRRQHHGLVALICALSDGLLMAVGVAGLGTLIATSPQALRLAAYGGAAFLVLYGLRALWQAIAPQADALEKARAVTASRAAVIAQTLAVTYLNPHVYLDTVLFLGSVGARFEPEGRVLFVLGGFSASILWFFGLAFGAAALAPVLARPLFWRILNGATAAIMLLVAWQLLRDTLGTTP